MAKLTAFNFISLNGFFKGENNDIGWHRHGEEENEFAVDSMKSDNILLFGRITFEMMAGYWPTPMAIKNDPVVAAGMNNSEKIVFSRTLKNAEWQNTKVMKENIVDEIKRMKNNPGKDMTILGSGSIVTLFSDHDLIDEYAIMVDPVVLSTGTNLFSGISKKLDLKLTSTRAFKSGVVLLNYQPQ